MKRIVSLLLVLALMSGTLTALTSCGAPKDNGAEIHIYLGAQVFDFDPSDYYVSANAEQILSLVYEPLFSVNKRGKIKCAAAKKYDVDKDENKIVITLRESYWSDNLQVRAADFVYAWCNRIIDSTYPNPAAALFLDIVGVEDVLRGTGNISDVGIKATEMDQITITYKEGADYKRILRNLASVATAPVRQDIVEPAETYWSKSSPITNGAFKVSTYNRSTGVFELARNVGYHQDPTVKDYDNKVRPGLLYGNFKFEGNEVTLGYDDIKNKTIFIMADAPISEREAYEKKAEVADHTSTYTYVFNTGKALFADVNVRLALSLAIDRAKIAEAIVFGKAADGFIPDVSGGAKDAIISADSDMPAAKQYLAKADQAVVAANKSFTLLIDSDEQSAKIAEIVKAAWTELGFDVTVTVAEPVETEIDGMTVVDSGIQYAIKNASYGSADFDVIAVDWQMFCRDALPGLASLTSTLNGMGKEQIAGTPSNGKDPADPDYVAGVPDSSKQRSNITGWSDSKYDALVAEALAETNKKERAKKLAEAEEYLMEQMPVCPLVFNQSFAFVGSKIAKFKYDGHGNFILTNVKLRGYRKYLKPEDED